jgi:hypothetical protein
VDGVFCHVSHLPRQVSSSLYSHGQQVRGFFLAPGRSSRFDHMGRWSGLFQVGILSSAGYDPAVKVDHPYCLDPRYALGYHSASQVLWGVGIGIIFGTVFYALTEFIPTRRPKSFLGTIRTWILTNEVSTWFRVRDGWLIWDDAGRETEWQRWRRALTSAGTKSE